jgi:hypothetical protein
LAALDAGEQHRHEQLPQPCAVAATAAAAVFVAATAAAAAICSASSQHHCRCSSLLCARPTSSATSWQMWAGSMAAGQHSTAAGRQHGRGPAQHGRGLAQHGPGQHSTYHSTRQWRT